VGGPNRELQRHFPQLESGMGRGDFPRLLRAQEVLHGLVLSCLLCKAVRHLKERQLQNQKAHSNGEL
jgi:hypothetical protein